MIRKWKSWMKHAAEKMAVNNKAGMEMVQVAILIALAIALGVIFKSEITQFVNDVFSKLQA